MRFGVWTARAGEMAFDNRAKPHALKIIWLEKTEGEGEFVLPRAARRREIAHRFRRKSKSLQRHRKGVRRPSIVRRGVHQLEPNACAFTEYRARRGVLIRFKGGVAVLYQRRGQPTRVSRIASRSFMSHAPHFSGARECILCAGHASSARDFAHAVPAGGCVRQPRRARILSRGKALCVGARLVRGFARDGEVARAQRVIGLIDECVNEKSRWLLG